MKTRITFILFVACFLNLGTITPTKIYLQQCWGANDNSEKVLISYTFKDKPIKDVLKKISEATGYNVTVNEEWAELSVTANLKNLSIDESLKEVLRNSNNIVITNEKEKYISIIIYSADQPPKDQEGVNGHMEEPINPSDMEVIPPAVPGEKGITQSELDSILAMQKEVDPLDVEVIPPTVLGQRGITQRELNALIERENKLDPLDIEVIPPAVPGEVGITQRELNSLKAPENNVDILDVEVIPPTVPGQRGITQRELNAIIARENKVNPEDLEVIPPSVPGGRGVTLRELKAMKGWY